MIKIITFTEALTIPGRIATLTTYNRTEHGKWVQVEETNFGLTLHISDADGKAIGDVDVYRHMIKQITREPRQQSSGGKGDRR